MDNTKPKISIITVVYNGIAEIENTIKSVINQTYENFEYIIIDGGSNDGTIDIIKKYQDKIDYWISEKDGGLYFAMNKGLEKATGDWINFRNCGDYYVSPSVIEDMFSYPINPDVVVLHGNCRMIDSTGFRNLEPPILTISYKKKMPVFHPCSFIRTNYHKEHPYNTSYRSSSDYNFFFNALKNKCKFEYRPILIASYDANDGFSLRNWEIALLEEWEWKHPNMLFRNFFAQIYIFIMSLRKKIARLRKRI